MTTRAVARRRLALKVAAANQSAEAGRLSGSTGVLMKMIMASASVLGLGGCAADFQSQPGVPPNQFIHPLSLEGGGG